MRPHVVNYIFLRESNNHEVSLFIFFIFVLLNSVYVQAGLVLYQLIGLHAEVLTTIASGCFFSQKAWSIKVHVQNNNVSDPTVGPSTCYNPVYGLYICP